MIELEDGSLFFGDPLYTSNPADPRLQRYNDSMSLYNAYKFQKDTQLKNLNASLNKNRANFSSQPEFNQWKGQYIASFGMTDPKFNKSSSRTEFQRAPSIKQDYLPEEKPIVDYFNKIAKSNKNFRASVHPSPDLWHKTIAPVGNYWDTVGYSPVYKKPVQPIVYKPEEELPMFTLPEVNVSGSNKIEPMPVTQTPAPQNMNLPPKWYSYQGPDKGILVDNKYMSTDEFDKYTQSNPNFRYVANPNSVGYVYRPGQGIVKYADGGEMSSWPRPTSTDSLNLYRNAVNVFDFYNKNKDYENRGATYGVNKNIFNDLELALKSFKDKDFPHADTNTIKEVPLSKYHKTLSPYLFNQRESANNWLNTKAPMPLYDRRINPTAEYYFGPSEKAKSTDQVVLSGYDPIAVKPYALLTPEELTLRQERYGVETPTFEPIKSKGSITPENANLPVQWYSYQGPDKGILMGNKYYSTEEFDKYIEQNPNYRYSAKPNSVGYVYRPGEGIVKYAEGGFSYTPPVNKNVMVQDNVSYNNGFIDTSKSGIPASVKAQTKAMLAAGSLALPFPANYGASLLGSTMDFYDAYNETNPQTRNELLTQAGLGLIPYGKAIKAVKPLVQVAPKANKMLNTLRGMSTLNAASDINDVKDAFENGGEFDFVRNQSPKVPTNFEQRFYHTPYIDNPDGSMSSHKMMSWSDENGEHTTPTIVYQNGKLVELTPEKAIDYAYKTGEYKTFGSLQESIDYGKNGYKYGTPMEIFTPNPEFEPNALYGGRDNQILNNNLTPELWEKRIRNVEKTIGDPSTWTLDSYNKLQNTLNDYKNWRENTPEGRSVIDYHNEPNEYVVPLPEHLKKYTKGGMTFLENGGMFFNFEK